MDAIDTPQSLRQKAEQAFRLASQTLDTAVHDALMLHSQELLSRAERMEAALDNLHKAETAA